MFIRCSLRITAAFFFAFLSVWPQQAVWAQEWVARYNGPANGSDFDSGFKTLVVDASGNSFVTGSSSGTGTGYDITTINYDTSGSRLWVARYNGPSNKNDYSHGIAIDPAGNSYVTGRSEHDGTGTDFITIKYDPNGNQLWAARFHGTSTGFDSGYAVVADSGGNAYVTGNSAASGTSPNMVTVKYDASGNQVWLTRTTTADTGIAIALDSAGRVCVAGRAVQPGSAGTMYDWRVAKFDADGTQLWVANYNGAANQSEEAYSIAVDAADNIYAAGYTTGSATSYDYLTIKYDPNGNQLWLATFDGPSHKGDIAYWVAVDASGNSYVTGGSAFSSQTTGVATVKYDSNGNLVWAARKDDPANYAAGYWVALDSQQNVYVTGLVPGSGGVHDLVALKYDANGNQLWSLQYNVPGGGDAYGETIALDGDGNVYVAGSSIGATSGYDIVTLKIANQYATTLTVPDVSGDAGKTVDLLATLTKSIDSAPVSGQPIAFTLNGTVIGSATTDSTGQAKLSYLIPASTPPGTMSIVASFAGAPGYLASSGTGTLTIRRPTALTITKASGSWGATIPLKATLKNGTTVLPNMTIRFRVDGNEVGSAVTSSTGVATLPHTLTETVGTHTLDAVFDGDATYKSAVSSATTLTIGLAGTTLSVASLTATPNQTVHLKAILKSGTTLLAGRDVSFKIDGNAVGTATTDGSGVALLAHVVTESLGTHTITAEFAGDGVNYAACTGSGSLKVLASTKIVADILSAPAGSSVVFGAKLLRSDTGTPLEGKTLNFYAGTTFLGAATTDPNGRATITTVAPAAGVKQAITVKFTGDAQYKASSGSGSITGV